ncbi:MAG: phosphoenolpyruvate synthase [Deltaproteobacteria bacterium]|nr:phosphoenolpyruvate synthase [Deltaproteobacteria bacterium]
MLLNEAGISRPLSVLPHSNFDPETAPSIVCDKGGERLTLAAFSQLAGRLAGYAFVKVVIDRQTSKVHFLNNCLYQFHADYIGDQLLQIPRAQLEADIDSYNQTFYFEPTRRFFLGILALHKREDRRFFSLETVEVDTMDVEMVKFFHRFIKDQVDASIPVLFKPANHLQETIVASVDPSALPRVFSHELFSSAEYIALNPGTAQGRLRVFRSQKDYLAAAATLEWYDIIVMDRVPDDIPRVTGIINAQHTTPLSHTNVLASGWQIPNAIQIGIVDRLAREGLNDAWVEYCVLLDAGQVALKRVERPASADQRPAWSVQKIKIEEPETEHTAIKSLDELRMSDRYKYGTKAANLGELGYVLRKGSERLTAFYRIPRPPRPNLMPYLAKQLGLPETAQLGQGASEYLRRLVKIPRGIAIPFSVQQDFLGSSPKIQQAIGKLKMALELNVRQIDSLCISLQQLIRSTRIPDEIRNYIDTQIALNLGGVSSFVVRSSSNAEDLAHFSAAGIYESINHVTTADNIFESIKTVWASLLSPRSVRLRQEVGISLDDCYMGVVVQEEVKSQMGGVLVTTNPLNRADFRNVYLNISPRSVIQIVQGSELPLQYLYNTVEGGGRTLSIGDAATDLNDDQKTMLSRLALAGRLLQSHFSPDYTFSMPVDIEWLVCEGQIYILQLRPYAK